MKYYINTEFKEYHKQVKFLGFKIGKPIPTIDLISIGIISEDDRTFYRLNKDVDLKAVWKDKWLRDNVLASIYSEMPVSFKSQRDFSYNTMRFLFNLVGETKKVIARKIKGFTSRYKIDSPLTNDSFSTHDLELASCRVIEMNSVKDGYKITDNGNVDFYGYYSDYNWVVFCQLFGRMIDLPKGFPMYCRDLKQILDEKADNYQKGVDYVKAMASYPKQSNEHNALDDAKWNKKLHEFINML